LQPSSANQIFYFGFCWNAMHDAPVHLRYKGISL
jgi:hypothetical protein